jgi:hypothetical protein
MYLRRVTLIMRDHVQGAHRCGRAYAIMLYCTVADIKALGWNSGLYPPGISPVLAGGPRTATETNQIDGHTLTSPSCTYVE